MPHRLPVRRGLARRVEVAPPQLVRLDAEQRGATAEDVLDHDHALRAAEAAERGVGLPVGLGDPAVHVDVGDPVGVVDVAERAGQHRLGQVEAPAAVAGQGRAQRVDPEVGVEADLPGGQERVPLAGHGDVLGAVEGQDHRPAGDHRTERGDRRETVRLELLAAEAAAHPQALHGHPVRTQPEHVGDDVLGLARVLGAGLDEDLAVLVDQSQGGVALQVEVLLAAELQLALEAVFRRLQPGVRVAATDRALVALIAVGLDRVAHADQRGQRLVVDLDRLGALPGRVGGLAEHPADRVAVEHDLVGKQRLVVLLTGVVEPRHVGGGQHLDHAGHLVGLLDSAARSPWRARAGPAAARHAARPWCG